MKILLPVSPGEPMVMVPRSVRALLGPPRTPMEEVAHSFHDSFYASGIAWVSRRQADRAFYANLRHGGTGLARAWALWLACRVFGLFYWRRSR